MIYSAQRLNHAKETFLLAEIILRDSKFSFNLYTDVD